MLGLLHKSNKASHNARAVVTGAGSGIGAAFAVELARRGGAVVCSDINEDNAAKTVRAVIDQGGKAVAIPCDVSRLEAPARLCGARITTILDNDLHYLDVRNDVQRRYNKRIQQRLTSAWTN